MSRLLVVVALLAACADKEPSGLPPAKEWKANTGDLPPVQQQGVGPSMGANPHGGMGANPHAGVPGAPDMSNPHGGGGAPDVAAMGLPAPDPNRKINPNNRVKGVLKIHPKAKDRIAAGGAVFITVKRAAADGTASGPPLAVEKLTWQKDEVPFELTERNAMIGGTSLDGDVVVTARYDQDGDALSKQPGDIVGTLRVKIPADNVKVTLDEILP